MNDEREYPDACQERKAEIEREMVADEKPELTGAIPSLPEDKLREIARDICEGRIFTDRHCEPGMMASVFMVAALGAITKEVEYLISNPNADDAMFLLYEYISQAGPRSVNGHPCFFSVNLLNRVDTIRVQELADEYKTLQQNFSQQ